MSGVSRPRLISKPFVAVTAATGAFFIYVGMLVPLLPTFIEDELGAGELGVGLSISAFAFAAIFARPLIGRLVERFGRRRVMIAGSLLAGLAGFLCATVNSLPPLLLLRGIAGIGEAAVFVAAATLVADLAPPDRRAEAASYFSVAVFGGIGIGPVIGEAVLQDDRFHLAFLVASSFTVLAAVMSLAVPHHVLAPFDDADLEPLPMYRGFAKFVHPAALGALASFPAAWALWASAVVIGVGMAFMYPSLMALTVNRVDDRERPVVIGSFTMFFEVGTVFGGIVLGTVAQLFGKRVSFGAAVLLCAFGLWLLRSRVAPADSAAIERARGPVYVPVAAD